MKISNGLVMRMYWAAMWLYPAGFRARYGAQMMDAVARMHAESDDDLRFVAGLVWDVMKTSAVEQFRMASAPTPGYGVAFVVIFSALLLAVSVGHQQWLRRGADRVPAKLADLLAQANILVHYTRQVRQPDGTVLTPIDKMVRAGDYELVLGSAGQVEISSEVWLKGTVPFAVLYDAAGKPLEGDARLHGLLPQPPVGIFDAIRQRGSDRVTWQPEPGIRVALVGEKLPEGGFVLAGQSLLGAEERTRLFDRWLMWMWGVMVAAVCVVVGRGMVRRQETVEP